MSESGSSGGWPSWMVVQEIDELPSGIECDEREELLGCRSFDDASQAGMAGVLRLQESMRRAFCGISGEDGPLWQAGDIEVEETALIAQDGDFAESPGSEVNLLSDEEIIEQLDAVLIGGNLELLDEMFVFLNLPSLPSESRVFEFLLECLLGDELRLYSIKMKIQILMMLTACLPGDPRVREVQIACMKSRNCDLKNMAVFSFGIRSDGDELPPEEKREDLDLLLKMFGQEKNFEMRLEIVIALIAMECKDAVNLLTGEELFTAFRLFFRRDFDFQQGIVRIVSELDALSPEAMKVLMEISCNDQCDEDFRCLIFSKILQLSEILTTEDLVEMLMVVDSGDKQAFLYAVYEIKPQLAQNLYQIIYEECVGPIASVFTSMQSARKTFPLAMASDFETGRFSTYDFVVANLLRVKLECENEEFTLDFVEEIKLLVRSAAIKPYLTLEYLQALSVAVYDQAVLRLENNVATGAEVELGRLADFEDAIYDDPEFQREALYFENRPFMSIVELLGRLSGEYRGMILEAIEDEMNLGVYNKMQISSLRKLKNLVISPVFES